MNTIKIETLSKKFVKKGTKSQTLVLFKVISGSVSDKKDVPTDLGIALDTSGSMRGESLQNAKIAIKNIIDNIGKNDTISLCTYNSTVNTIFKFGKRCDKEKLMEKLNYIDANGATDIYSGMFETFSVLQEGKNPAKRLFLLTDGIITFGIHEHELIFERCREYAKKGINITTFGLGSEFDANLMKGISKNGQGSYFYIEDKLAIEKIISIAYREAKNLIGKNAIMSLKLLNNAKITKIYARDQKEIVNGINFGDIAEDDTRTVLVEIETDGTAENCFDYEFTMDSNNPDMKMLNLKGTHSIKLSENEKEYNLEENEIKVMKNIFLCTENDKKIEQILGNSTYEEAIKIQEESIKLLEEVKQFENANFMVTFLLSEAKRRMDMLKEKNENAKNNFSFSEVMSQSFGTILKFTEKKVNQPEGKSKKRKRDDNKTEEEKKEENPNKKQKK